MLVRWCLPSLLVACATAAGPVGIDPAESGDTGSGTVVAGSGSAAAVVIPDVRCSGAPDAGPAGDFNHFSSSVTAALASPQHRGFDLIAAATANPQKLEGWISYGLADKALEDEDVDLFACRQQAWQKVGSARTDDEGHFSLALSDGDRLPIGMRDLYVSVVGDRTGAAFLGYVAPEGTQLAISDVDGTLTASENAFLDSIVTGATVDAQPGAGAAYTELLTRHVQVVYLSARGSQYTGATRTWLDGAGFPRGPVRLASSFVTLPGSSTISFKTDAMAALEHLTLFAGIGNRDSDVQAYTAAGIAADHIFVKLPEYVDELQADLTGGAATGFATYGDLQTTFIDPLPH
jgi:phosphatidate phosphatase PAH1